MGRKLNKLKKIRIHREGTHTLIAGAGVLLLFNACLYYAFECKLPFFRCPVRRFEGDTENVVVAPADGKIVVIEEVDENEYFHDRRLMVSIFMSLTNVHANWIPVDGTVRLVEHHDGNFHKAWLPKASIENERSTIVIETPDGVFIMARQIAGAMARRIVTYAREDEDCYIDEHMGFIKFGSRVDLFLPVGTKVNVKLGQKTVGNETIIAKL